MYKSSFAHPESLKVAESRCPLGLGCAWDLYKRSLVLAVIFFAMASCENDIQEVNIITQKDNYATESARHLEVIYSDSARVKARITTPELNRYYTVKEPYTELPKGVKMEFFNDSLIVMSTLTANYAKRNDVTKEMLAKSNVVVVNRKGERLNTEELTWDERTGLFTSNAYVKITKPDQIIYGTGFRANEDFTSYKISNISGIITIQKSE